MADASQGERGLAADGRIGVPGGAAQERPVVGPRILGGEDASQGLDYRFIPLGWKRAGRENREATGGQDRA